MNKLLPAIALRSRKRQAGIAAIEFALCVPILIGFLLMPIFLAKVFWHYTIAQKAAQDATRYLSTVSTAEMITPASARAAGELAQEIVRRQVAEMSPDAQITTFQAFCNIGDSANSASHCGGSLGGTLPTTVRMSFQFAMYDPLEMFDFGWDGLQIHANYTLHYAGN